MHNQLSFRFRAFDKSVEFQFHEKMDVLEQLDNVKPYNGFVKLAIGYHSIERFRDVKNRFVKNEGVPGRTILVELKNEVVFLPQYWSEKIALLGIDKLNEQLENKREIFLYFGGKYGDTK